MLFIISPIPAKIDPNIIMVFSKDVGKSPILREKNIEVTITKNPKPISINPKIARFLLENKINIPISEEREVIAKLTPLLKEFINLKGVYTIVLLIIDIMPKVIKIKPRISDITLFNESNENLVVGNFLNLFVANNLDLFRFKVANLYELNNFALFVATYVLELFLLFKIAILIYFKGDRVIEL